MSFTERQLIYVAGASYSAQGSERGSSPNPVNAVGDALPPGTVVVKVGPIDPDTGLRGVAYGTPDGQLIISFKGTDFTSATDMGVNVQIAQGIPPGGVKELAAAFIDQAVSNFGGTPGLEGLSPSNIVFASHSRGATDTLLGLGQYLSVTPDFAARAVPV
jgi:hypothetical protein